MKKLLLTLVAMLSVTFGFAQTNLLPNGDFETWTDDTTPTSWLSAKVTSTGNTAGSNVKLAKSSDAHGGAAAVQVTNSTKAQSKPSNGRIASEPISLKAGKYTYTAYLKAATDSVAPRLGYTPLKDGKPNGYEWADNRNGFAGPDTLLATEGWVKLEYTFTLTEDSEVCLLTMHSNKLVQGVFLMDDATLVEEEGGGEDTPDVPADAITIAAAQATAAGTQVTVVGTCMAQTKTGAVLADETGIIFHFVNDTDAPNYKIGDKVSITGKLSEYGGFKQFSTKNDATTTATVLSSGTATYPTPEEMTGADLDAWVASPAIKYVQYTGKLSISGNYYNVAVDGASTAVGSIIKPTDDLTAKMNNGNTYVFTGYAVYLSGSKYVNTVLTSVKAEGEEVILKDISNTPETAYTIAKAKELVADANNDLSKTVYVKGTIKGTPKVDLTYGNANYYIQDGADTLYIYRGLDFAKAKFTAEDQIKDGDAVVICGQLTTYNDVPQMAQGNYLYSLNGATERVAPSVEKPALSLSAGSYLVADKLPLTITCATEGAKIMYTIDGEDADENNYTEALAIEPGTHTVKAIAQATDGTMSSEVSATYVVSTPAAFAFANGDFETWEEKVPTGWTTVTTASSKKYTQSTDAHAGNSSCLLTGIASGNQRLAYNEMTVPAGWYTMSAYAKDASEGTTAAAKATIGYATIAMQEAGYYKTGDYVYPKDAEGTNIVYTDLSSTEWTQITFTFQLSEELVISPVVMNRCKNSDKLVYSILVDDVEFRAATQDEIDAVGVQGVAAAQKSSAIYDLSGRRVEKAQKGIYIIGGRKVVK